MQQAWQRGLSQELIQRKESQFEQVVVKHRNQDDPYLYGLVEVSSELLINVCQKAEEQWQIEEPGHKDSGKSLVE
jgi:hypothetical protein